MAAQTQREALQRRGQHGDLRTADPRYGVNSPAPTGASTRRAPAYSYALACSSYSSA
jgi:hypothetical protein